MRKYNTESLADVLRRYLREEGVETPLNEHRLISAWEEVVGSAIARYTTSLFIRNQVLHVHLSSSVLRQELMMTRKILVRRLNEKVGAQVIVDIEFR